MHGRAVALILPLALLLGACSGSTTVPTATDARSDVGVVMTDAMRFDPAAITARVRVPITSS